MFFLLFDWRTRIRTNNYRSGSGSWRPKKLDFFLLFDGRIRIRANNYGSGSGSWRPENSRILFLLITLLVWAQEPVPAAGEPAEAFLHAAGGKGGGEGHPADQ